MNQPVHLNGSHLSELAKHSNYDVYNRTFDNLKQLRHTEDSVEDIIKITLFQN